VPRPTTSVPTDGTEQKPPPYKNSILARLPPAEIEHLAPKIKRMTLELHTVLYDPGDVVQFGYFPDTGLISLIAVMKSGEQVEVGIVGREGLVANSVVLGGTKATQLALVQSSPLIADRIGVDALREAFKTLPVFQKNILRFVRGQSMMLSQGAACNRLHEAEARLARWLLMCEDRMNGDTITLTHEFMADMLGVRRTTVTLVAGTLHRAGLIEYSRGKIKILNRAELELAACECYGVYKEQFDLLTGDGHHK
jgi:CRP-like cAMP-binding protein